MVLKKLSNILSLQTYFSTVFITSTLLLTTRHRVQSFNRQKSLLDYFLKRFFVKILDDPRYFYNFEHYTFKVEIAM